MVKRTPPFMSIVVLAYNAAATIERALDSLLMQDYPEDRYEIIVIDDGSTDHTPRILAAYKRHSVRVITFPHNKGIPYGRNAGLAAAKGDIYVGFDGDCVAEPDWLRQLVKGYDLPAVAGVGGSIVPRADLKLKGLATQYIEATGSGTARGNNTGPASLPPMVRRFVAYLLSGLVRRQAPPHQPAYTEVAELFGANSSFPMEVLRTVGGWDPRTAAPAVGGIEDRDLSERIHAVFPTRHFYAISAARLRHDPTISLKNYLLRPYRRGPFNYRFYRRNGIVPPLFPFPPVVLMVWLVLAAWRPLWLPLALLLLPQLCYFWWLQRSVLERRVLYMLFPYLQLAEETMVIAGLLRGIIWHTGR